MSAAAIPAVTRSKNYQGTSLVDPVNEEKHNWSA